MCAWLRWTLAALLLPALAAGSENVTVVRQRLTLEELHTVIVDVNTEYILDFIPTEEQSQWPTRVWVRSDGGDTSHPLLLTHRQNAGAGTWQVPTLSDGQLLFEFERTLCPDSSVPSGDSDCVDPASVRARGWFSVHAVSACARPLRAELFAAPARDWRLTSARPLHTQVTPERPRVHYYMFEEGEEHIRLVISSEDDVCATIAVQNYSCPIMETLADLEVATVRMTVQRSGAVQLARRRFPNGFYIVSVAHTTDTACDGTHPADEDWLWEAAVFGESRSEPPRPRIKLLTLDTRPALSRTQYVVAMVVTLVFFLSFYLVFGLLVLAQRWPRFGRLVQPKAVLKDTSGDNGVESQTDASQAVADTPRRRRASDATFDSSDNSDTDESEEPTPPPQQRRGLQRDVTGRPARPGDVTGRPARPGDVTGRPARPGDVAGRPARPGDVTDQPRRDFTDSGDVTAPSGPVVNGANQITADVGDNRRTTVDADVLGSNSVYNGQQQAEPRHPYGLPTQLRVAALSRRKARVLRARSDRYLTTLATVALFYALPVVQFVVAFQIVMNVSGSLDLCYYNFLCAHPAGQLSDFNHVLSNLGYLLLGALFMLQLRRRRRNRKRVPKDEEYGIPAHYGLLASLGAGMMVVALLSASYHVCPNRLNFQFDVAFMYVLAVLSMVKIYQSRHPDVNARAHATFGVLAVLIAIVVWGVLGGGALFWGVFTVLHVFTVLLLSLRIYYIGQFRLEKETFEWAARELRAMPSRGLRPLYSARLTLLLIANALNWAFALYGLFTQSADFASHLLFVLLGNTLVYMVFYLSMKLLHGERPRWYAWCFLAGAAAAWAPALYLFTSGSSSWSSTPAQSRHRNHECRVLEFYDSHDLWHVLSAIALYLTFNAMLTWDDGLAAVPRSEIAVF